MQYQTTTQVATWNPLANRYATGGPLARLADGAGPPPVRPDRDGGGGGGPFGARQEPCPDCPGTPAWAWLVLALAAVETIALLMAMK